MTRALPGGLIIALWLPASAWALQPLITDDTGTQGAGGNQVELSYNRFVEREPGTKAVTVSLPLVYTRGLTEAVDIYLGGSYVQFRPPASDSTGSDAGNLVAGLKWRFFESETGDLSLAFKPEIRFPVSSRAEDRGLGSGKLNGGAALLLTQETGFGAIHANLAVSSQHFTLPENQMIHRSTLWRLSVAPVWDVSEKWKVVVDTGLVTNPHRVEKARMGYLELGAIYAPGKDLDLAAGIVRDLDHEGHDVLLLTLGITWRFR